MADERSRGRGGDHCRHAHGSAYGREIQDEHARQREIEREPGHKFRDVAPREPAERDAERDRSMRESCNTVREGEPQKQPPRQPEREPAPQVERESRQKVVEMDFDL